MFVGTLGEGIMIVWRARAAGRRRGRGRGGGGEGRGCRGRDQWNVNAFLLTKKLERKMSFEVSVCAEDIRFSMRAAASQRSLVAFCFVVETFDFSSSFSFFFFSLYGAEKESPSLVLVFFLFPHPIVTFQSHFLLQLEHIAPTASRA